MASNAEAIVALPLEKILEDRQFNIRILYGDIDKLALQLMTEGPREPLKVRREGERFFLVDGHRRQRAYTRSREFRIERTDGKYLVLENGRPFREAAGPLHRDFDPGRIPCRIVDGQSSEEELFASQVIYNSGKPFTVLERMLFLSRLNRMGSLTREQLALKTGVSRTHVANALNLNSADPRLLECVREGRISQKVALRLLRLYSADEQMTRICAAIAKARRFHRDKLLPKDFDWGETARADGERAPDPVRARMQALVAKLQDAMRFAPNAASQDRLATLDLIYRHATGKLTYAKLEEHLLGRV